MKCSAHHPQMPLQPVFSFKGSPSSLRLMDIPKKISQWDITRVYIKVLSPNNETTITDCVRIGSVWVGTFNGCDIVGKVSQGIEVMADGVDENESPIEGYVLGVADYIVMDKNQDVKAQLEKHSVKFLDELPTTPSKGDVVYYNGSFQMFDGANWLEFDNKEVIARIDSEIDAINEDIDNVKQDAMALEGRFDTLESDVNEISNSIPTKVSELENDSGFATQADVPTKVSELENDQGYITLSSVPTKVSELENDSGFITQANVPTKTSELVNDSGFITQNEVDLGNVMKYDDNEHMTAHLGFEGHPFQMTLAHSAQDGGKITFGENAYIDDNHFTFANKDAYLILGGNLHNGYVDIGPNIHINGSTVEGKSNIMIDGKWLLIQTPPETKEGQTLKAVKVVDATSRATTLEAEPPSHIEWESVDAISKTSQLENDSGFITQNEVDLGNVMKYDDNEHMTAHLGFEGHPFQMTLAHSAENGGKIIFGENAYIDGNHLNFANIDSVLNLGGNLCNGYVYIGPNIQIIGMREEGKSNIAVDGKMLIKTPQDTREGQTLKAVNVSDSVGTSHIEWVAVDPESSVVTFRTWED